MLKHASIKSIDVERNFYHENILEVTDDKF